MKSGESSPPTAAAWHDKRDIDDYPYGKQRTEAKLEIETGKDGRQRGVMTTKNPKTERWNKSKKTTYSNKMKIMEDGEGKHYFVSDGGDGSVSVSGIAQKGPGWYLRHSDKDGDDPGHHEMHYGLHGKTINERKTAASTPEAREKMAELRAGIKQEYDQRVAKEKETLERHTNADTRTKKENAIGVHFSKYQKAKGRGKNREVMLGNHAEHINEKVTYGTTKAIRFV